MFDDDGDACIPNLDEFLEKKNSKWGVISASKKSLQIYAYLPNSFPKQWLGGGVGFRGLVGQRTPFWVFPGNSSKLGDTGVP